MIKVFSQPSTCDCGSGKPYHQCCGIVDECKVIHFPWGKKNQYKNLIEVALNDLVSYVKAYFYNYKDAAWAKFISYANTDELDEYFSSVFWHWYVLNYRCYKDVSPIIDFYLSENLEKMDEKYIAVLEALKHSYLSLYTVKWISNNAVAIQDSFLGHEYIIERNFGSATRLVNEGSLILARLVIVGNSTMLAGKVIMVQSDQLNYLREEMESIKSSEQVEDSKLFLHEYGEVLTGLILDLTHGIKKNRIKAKTLWLDKSERRLLLKPLLANNLFHVIERNNSWIKLSFNQEKDSFNRVYVLKGALVIVSESLEDINEIIKCIDLMKLNISSSFTDGFSFVSEEEAEEVLLEIMHDRYLDEWLNSPHLELEGMTPLQAVADIKGRALLESLLSDLELLELRAKSKNEYYLPTTVIRNKLKLDKGFNKELLHPDAVAIKVRKNRLHQELSPFVTAYNWFNEEYRQVAIAAFDWLFADKKERGKLAWILFMWNEYSSIYRPRTSRSRVILAALENIYLELTDKRVSYSWSSKRYEVPSGLISKNAGLFLRHFNQYPLDFNLPVAGYPKWEELTYNEKMKAYDEIWQHLNLFTYAIKPKWIENEAASKKEFYQVQDNQKFWTKEIEKIFDDFYKYHYKLDFQDKEKHTIANLFWESQAKRFPPYLKTAAFNIMMSYVGVYKIYPEGTNNLIFEDYFTGKTYQAYGNFGIKVHDNIVPGMLGLTRLLPLGDKLWVTDPMYVVLPDLIDLFEKNLEILLEEYHPYDPSDFQYLKKRGEMVIKSHILAMSELEQNAVSLMNQPLQIDWHMAGIINYELIVNLLGQSRKLKVISASSELTTFLWMSFNASQQYQWGYIMVTRENILITTPPGKNMQKFIRDIRLALRNEDIVIAFRPWEASISKLKSLENRMVQDLAEFFNNNPDLSLALLRQDEIGDEETEWQQGIFLLKLGSLLMDYIEKFKQSHN